MCAGKAMARRTLLRRTSRIPSRLDCLRVSRVDRQRADALSSRGIDRVADRRRDRRYPGLAHAPGRGVALDNVDVGRGRDVGGRDQVIAEIALLDLPRLYRDVTVERVADAHDGGSLELGAYPIRIDDKTAIDRHVDAGDGD